MIKTKIIQLIYAQQTEQSATVGRGTAGSYSAAAPLSLSILHKYVFFSHLLDNDWVTDASVYVKTKRGLFKCQTFNRFV